MRDISRGFMVYLIESDDKFQNCSTQFKRSRADHSEKFQAVPRSCRLRVTKGQLTPPPVAPLVSRDLGDLP